MAEYLTDREEVAGQPMEVCSRAVPIGYNCDNTDKSSNIKALLP